MDHSLPQNQQAEMALLGAILNDNELFDKVSFLGDHHFYDELHGRIFTAAGKLVQTGKQASFISLKPFFEREEPIGELSIDAYLRTLAQEVPLNIDVVTCAESIRDLAMRRHLIEIGSSMVASAYNAKIEIDPNQQISEAEQRLYALAETDKYGAGFDSLESAIDKALNVAALAYGRNTQLSGISTGFVSLDKQLGGLQPSDLVIIAGRPSMGKTCLASNIAYNVALSGTPVGFFSLEMSAEQLAIRILAEQAQIPSVDIRSGSFTASDFDKLQRAADMLRKAPLHIDESGLLNMAQLSARARKLKRQKGLGLVVVDYLQLISGSVKRSREGRTQEVTEISTHLKALAKELHVPVVALSQLSRGVESRDDKRPMLSDLRESGSIEQDADVVMFIFREEYYLERRDKVVPDEKRGLAEILISKQRHGPTGVVELTFIPTYTCFRDKEQPPRGEAIT